MELGDKVSGFEDNLKPFKLFELDGSCCVLLICVIAIEPLTFL